MNKRMSLLGAFAAEWEEYEQTVRRSERHTVDLSIKVEGFLAKGHLLRRWYGDVQLPIRLPIHFIGRYG
jgi:hypothetical protein